MPSNDFEAKVKQLKESGWKVERALSGYVPVNPQGELEWWRGVDGNEEHCWRDLIDYPVVPKPDLTGATPSQRHAIEFLVRRKPQPKTGDNNEQ